jgi:hypothetical protein
MILKTIILLSFPWGFCSWDLNLNCEILKCTVLSRF